jgi:hypothetical protein|tara:strand:- start:73 stop:252 length:180 start_codon:yes stop_codon:yes gene_type:complete
MNKEIWYRNSIYKLSGGTMDLEERVQKLEEESETSKKKLYYERIIVLALIGYLYLKVVI